VVAKAGLTVFPFPDGKTFTSLPYYFPSSKTHFVHTLGLVSKTHFVHTMGLVSKTHFVYTMGLVSKTHFVHTMVLVSKAHFVHTMGLVINSFCWRVQQMSPWHWVSKVVKSGLLITF
jgi:hypothetical protein